MKNLKITEDYISILNEELTISHGYIVNVDKCYHLIQTNMRRVAIDDYLSWGIIAIIIKI